MEPELLWAARCKGVMRSRFSAWMLACECCPPFLDQRKRPQWASRAWAFTRAWEMPSKPCRAAQWRGVCAKPSCTSKNFDKGNRHDENCQGFGFKVQELLQLQMSEHLFEFAAVGVAPSFSKASRFACGQIQKSIVGLSTRMRAISCMETIYMGSVKCKGPNSNLVLTSYVKTLQERGSNQQTCRPKCHTWTARSLPGGHVWQEIPWQPHGNLYRKRREPCPSSILWSYINLGSKRKSFKLVYINVALDCGGIGDTEFTCASLGHLHRQLVIIHPWDSSACHPALW